MSRIDPLPEFLKRYLAGFVARRKVILALRAVGYGVGSLIGWLLIACVVDRLFQLPEEARWVMFSVGALVAAGGLGLAVWQLVRRIDWNVAAERIEARTEVFDERLRTVTSRLLADDEGRTSSALLRQSIDELAHAVRTASVKQLMPWRRALGPWALALLAGGVLSVAVLVPPWRFDLLLARALFPHRPIDPVTYIQMRVLPKNVSVSPGETVTIAVDVAPDQAGAVQATGIDLYLSSDRKHWSRSAMTEEGEGGYQFSIPAIERHLSYYVQAGQARSDVYSIQVHRVPAVREFRIRYDYPEYANHPPINVTNNDGALECLANSTATVRVIATEPLEMATWILNGQRLAMSATDRAEEWTISLPIEHDGSSSLEMTSSAGVGGGGPSPMTVRAIADEAPRPIVELPSMDLCLEPGDSTMVRFLATDDYGLHALNCQVRVNGRSAATATVPISTRPLRREGQFVLDLTALHVSVGDVVTLVVEAEDEWRQSKFSEARTILIAGSSIPAEAYHLVEELKRSESLCKAWVDSLNAARKALNSTKGDQESQTKLGKVISAANDEAAALRQSLLRAIVRAETADLADGLVGWIDQAEGVSPDPSHVNSLAARLDVLIARGRAMTGAIKKTGEGRRAAILEKQWANHNAQASAPARSGGTDPAAAEAAELHNKALTHLKDAVDAERAALGLQKDLDFARQLREKIAEGNDALAGVHRPDWAAAAKKWAEQLSKSDAAETSSEFAARLNAASIATALRFDGDVIEARDLFLAGRAVGRLKEGVISPRAGAEQRAKPQTAPTNVIQIQKAMEQVFGGGDADAGRVALASLAGVSEDSGDVSARAALAAAACVSRRLFDACAANDAVLAGEIAKLSPEASARFLQDVSQLNDLLREVDELITRQLVLQKAGAGGAEGELRLADDIGALGWPAESVPTGNGSPPVPAALAFESARPPDVAAVRPADRSPIKLAEWFARRASGSGDAAGDMERVAGNLMRAARQLVHRATLRRLAEVSAIAPLLASSTAETPSRFDLSGDWVKEWQRLESRSSSPTPRDASSANLDDQLRAYFESISKGQKEH